MDLAPLVLENADAAAGEFGVADQSESQGDQGVPRLTAVAVHKGVGGDEAVAGVKEHGLLRQQRELGRRARVGVVLVNELVYQSLAHRDVVCAASLAREVVRFAGLEFHVAGEEGHCRMQCAEDVPAARLATVPSNARAGAPPEIEHVAAQRRPDGGVLAEQEKKLSQLGLRQAAAPPVEEFGNDDVYAGGCGRSGAGFGVGLGRSVGEPLCVPVKGLLVVVRPWRYAFGVTC